MPGSVSGIHHVTGICGDPVRNLAFYSGLLGLRLVKKTVNFDDPGSYHLYYGDGAGRPGTLITFFAWTATPPLTPALGKQGARQIGATSFSVPVGSLDFWAGRLADAALEFAGPVRRFDEEVLVFEDPDGLPLELAGHAAGGPPAEPWVGATVPPEHAIRGIRGVALRLADVAASGAFLGETMGFVPVGSEGARHRLRVGKTATRSVIDLLHVPHDPPGRMGIGVMHHVAWRAPSDKAQLAWQARVAAAGIAVTDVKDRQYFRSIYFNEPGGVVFEVATDGPGFAVDEPAGQLGTTLKLPPWLEARRAAIEARLPDLSPRAPLTPSR